MLSSSRYTVKLEKPASEVLVDVDLDVQATVLAILKELETDPFLFVTGGTAWRESKAFKALKKAGYNVRVLKAREVDKWRVFYYVDQRRRVVLVKEIVERNADTYDLRSPHVARLKKSFRDYFQGGVRAPAANVH